MDSKGWTPFEDQEPEESVCLHGYLLIWHVFRGVIAEPWENRHQTPMFTHWKPMPRKGWINAAERKPTKEEADFSGCVLARYEDGEIRVTGWHQFRHNLGLTHWMPTPTPPDNQSEYRKKF